MAQSAERKWQKIADEQLTHRDVTSGTGFGRSEGLRVSGKVFAMLVKGELVVKLPRDRVAELVASGHGQPFDPGHGRLMKEWISVHPNASRRWPSLVAEAHEFVSSAAKPKARKAGTKR